MNQIIDINRFGNLILRSLVQYKQVYLRLGLICLATFILLGCGYAFNVIDSMILYMLLVNTIIVISPVTFFFKRRTHTSHFFEFTLPASVLEKFLVKLLNCILIFPAFIIALSFLLIGAAKVLPVEALNDAATHAYTLVKEGTICQYWNLIAVQSVFLCGSYFFKDSVFIKTILASVGVFIIVMTISVIYVYILVDFSFENIKPGFAGNSDILESSESFIRYILYFIQYFIPAGLWVASFLKLKETEI